MVLPPHAPTPCPLLKGEGEKTNYAIIPHLERREKC